MEMNVLNTSILKYGERIYVDGIYNSIPQDIFLSSAQVLLEKGYKVLLLEILKLFLMQQLKI